MNSTTTTIRRATTTAVLVGAALLVAAPAHARVAPDDTTATGPSAAQPAQQGEIGTRGASAPVVGVNVQRMARAMHDPQAGSLSNPSAPSDPRDPSSVPVNVLALLGAGLIAGAGGFTIYRFRHHGPAGVAAA